MQNKIPVWTTVVESYRFAFLNFVNNLGATWMPLVAMMAAGYFLTPKYLAATQNAMPLQAVGAGGSGDAAANIALQNNLRTMLETAPYVTAMWVLNFVCIASISVGIVREALQLRSGQAYLQSPVGPPVWRLMANWLLLLVAFFALYIVVLIAIVILAVVAAVVIGVGASQGGATVTASQGSVVGSVWLTIVAVVCLVGLGGAITYVVVRFTFLITPVVVAEERIALFRSWEITRGNFWRLMTIGLGVWLPSFLAGFAYLNVVMGPDWIPPLHFPINPQDMVTWSQHATVLSQRAIESSRRLWFVIYPAGLLFSVVSYGLSNGAMAFCYRAVVATKPGRAPTSV